MDSQTRPYLGDRRTTLEHLRAFAAIADEGGFLAASTKLHRTQSAITQNLQKLEQILGCKLLRRSQGRVIGLTEEGERFLPYVKDIFRQLADAIAALQKPALSGHIRVGVPDDFNVKNIQRALSRCLELNPALTIEIQSTLSGNITSLLQADQLDVAIYRTAASERTGRANPKPLMTESLHWVSGQQSDFKSYQEVPLVTFPDGCPYRKSALEGLQAAHKSVRVTYTGISYENVISAVMTGLGIAALPHSAIAEGMVILDGRQGYPTLPDIDLVMKVNSSRAIYAQFAEYLVTACKLILSPAVVRHSGLGRDAA